MLYYHEDADDATVAAKHWDDLQQKKVVDHCTTTYWYTQEA